MEADFVAACVEEIALEGLDGITLPSLWLRLAERPVFPLALDDRAKGFIWRTILQQDCIGMYILPEPRPVIVIDNRENYTDPETGICVEPELLPEEFYPVHPVNKDGVRGSCGTYDTRQNITEEIRQTGMSLEDVMKLWDQRLVLVASQKVRTRALFGETSNPNLDITDLTYCILERIGRSRYEGELMGGKVLVRAFKAYKLTPKDVFYHRKLLFRFGLIKKQPFVTRNVTNTMSRLILVHLPRFFKLVRTRYSLLLTKLCQKIAEYPNHVCERKICRETLGVDSNSFKRIMPLASPYLKLSNMKYADLYPDSAEEDHYHVNGKERSVSVVIMVKKFPPESDDEDEEAGESEEEEEDDVPEQTDGMMHEFSCRLENLPHERVFLHKMYERLEAAGSEGMTQRACEKLFNITRLEARGALRSMQKLGMVAEPFMKDFGRQRIGVYVSSRYAQTSQIHRKIEEEKTKLLQLYHGSPEKESKTPAKKGKVGDTIIKSMESVLPDAAPKTEEEEETEDDSTSLDTVRLNSQLPKPTIYMTNVSLQRVNIILAAVREAKLIENVFTLLKLIISKEANNSDVQGRIDRKSLLRLISRLAKAGQINSIKTTIQADNRQKELHFICDPSVGPTDPLVTSAIEQARLKHFMVHKEACRPSKSISDVHDQSMLSDPGTDSSMGGAV
ncbi:general transcription factor 3C polypeptide 1-like [Liolophura sinensis]|uniref:general transcription factor 3C polypeptide 1-like n=1 Tax=Liolophura sinensis TaxID=3198878 RepID=UPI00315958AE